MAQFIAVVFMVVYLVFLIYGSISGYHQLRNEAFLSPDLYAGECKEEPISLTNVYEADSQGLWETQTGFISTRSMYALDMRGTTITTFQYPYVMGNFKDRFEEAADKCTRRDLSYSMLALASFNLAHEETHINFYTNARAEKVFGSAIYASAIANKDSICDTPNSGAFNPQTSAVSFRIKFKDPSDPTFANCDKLKVSDFDLGDIDDNGYKTLKFDIRSISTAVAVNLGMTKVADDLTKIEDPLGYFDYYDFVYYNTIWSVSFYVDPFYDDMAPILCFDGSKYGLGDYCLLEGYYGNHFYPMITQYGHWWEEKKCSCGDSGTINEPDMVYYCSQPDYLVSLAYIPGGSIFNVSADYTIMTFADSMSQKVYDDPDNGDLEVTSLFHAPQFRSIMSMGSLSDGFRDLCEGRCSLLTIEFWGSTTSPMNFRGTPVYSMFEETAMIACANGLYRPEAYEPLISQPPVTLVQGYYTCVPNRTVALQRAVGISAGSAALYAAIALNVLLSTVLYIYNFFADEKIINPADKKKIVEDDIDQLKKEVARIAQINQLLEQKLDSLLIDSVKKI